MTSPTTTYTNKLLDGTTRAAYSSHARDDEDWAVEQAAKLARDNFPHLSRARVEQTLLLAVRSLRGANTRKNTRVRRPEPVVEPPVGDAEVRARRPQPTPPATQPVLV